MYKKHTDRVPSTVKDTAFVVDANKPKDRYGYVYHFVFTRPTDGHEFHYIGQHVGTKAAPGYFGSGLRLKNLIKKYGRKENLKRYGLMWCYSQPELTFAEILMICFAKELYGDDCINLQHGGDHGHLHTITRKRIGAGLVNHYTSPEGKDTRSRISHSKKTLFASPEGDVVRHKMSASLKKYLESPDARARRSASAKAQYESPAGKRSRALKSASLKAFYASPGADKVREKISSVHKNKVVSRASREKMSASKKALFASPEGDRLRKRISEARKHRPPRTAESLALTSASCKAAWAKRKAEAAKKAHRKAIR